MAFPVALDWLTPVIESVYRIKAPQRRRTSPMKVLALGLGRCGTESLKVALDELGCKTYHGWATTIDIGDSLAWSRLVRAKYSGQTITREQFDEILGECTAVTDMPCAMFARELVLAYPEAKVIINSRDVNSWYQSMQIFVHMRKDWVLWSHAFFNTDLFWIRYIWHSVMFPCFYGTIEATARWRFEEHYAMLRGLDVRSGSLEWTVHDGWKPLCEFLDRPVPKKEFPSGNSTQETMARAGAIIEDRKHAARLNMCYLVAFIGCIVGTSMYVRR